MKCMPVHRIRCSSAYSRSRHTTAAQQYRLIYTTSWIPTAVTAQSDALSKLCTSLARINTTFYPNLVAAMKRTFFPALFSAIALSTRHCCSVALSYPSPMVSVCSSGKVTPMPHPFLLSYRLGGSSSICIPRHPFTAVGEKVRPPHRHRAAGANEYAAVLFFC